ncbi:hypothetical protein O6H91_01G103600 [Diphasiastrum complanatum]|uniref:Uncharacterized protein n=1 Tax=Diphasiastrum complanatum TaxID=34168 RepID=A0ACC2EUB1_DIPCM|nr:hypothetical protein O6H91_01G103600 [Diphasiastrum complanatum]
MLLMERSTASSSCAIYYVVNEDGQPSEAVAEAAPPPASATGPSFAEAWFDDPVEGEAAQKAALEMNERIEVKAMTVRQYLESTVVPLLLQGLQYLVLERPTNPVEYLAAFLLKNNPHKLEPPLEVKELPKEGESKEAEPASTFPDPIFTARPVEVKAPSEAD